jgi:hypothetical protein
MEIRVRIDKGYERLRESNELNLICVYLFMSRILTFPIFIFAILQAF